MKFLITSKFLMILISPFLAFLIVLNFAAFDMNFYQKKFSEYQVHKEVGNADSLHKDVTDFLNGKNGELPLGFNEREKKHLWDVRKVVGISTILLYILITLFVLLLISSAFILKVNSQIINFVSKVLIFGGFLTVVLSLILVLYISYNFSAAFESFHRLFFKQGTYTFDPAKEMLTRLYPEQLFMDLGIRISKWVVIGSVGIILLGMLLSSKSKNK